MAGDDELLTRLGAALRPTRREIDPARVEALRTAVAARSSSAPAPAAPEAVPRRWRVLGPVMAVAAVVGAFLLGGALLGSGGGEEVPAGATVEFEETLRGPGDATAQATGILSGIGRTVELRTDDLAILPEGELYELWFVGPGDDPRSPNRISAGTFHPDQDGRTDVDLTAAADPALYPVLSVTAEPGDGNPARTGPEVLRARIDLDD